MDKSIGGLEQLLSELNRRGIGGYRRYQAVRAFLNYRARQMNVPLSGSFELTPLCNLRCAMCYVRLDPWDMGERSLLSAREWTDIMSRAIDGGMMYAALTGGECLTHPGFREIYLFLQSRGIETEVLTNGVLLDGELFEFFRENPPACIRVTLYGAGDDGYERVCGSRVFDRVWGNILRLREEKLPLSVSLTPNLLMTDGVAAVEMLHSAGIPFRINAGLIAPREETGRSFCGGELDAAVEMIKAKLSCEGGHWHEECDAGALPEPGGAGGAQRGVRCGAGRSGFAVSWDGTMRPCPGFPTVKENVLSLGFEEAWRRMNKSVLDFPRPEECVGCRYEKVCKHCVAEHASAAPVGHASPAVCAWVSRMAAEGLVKL